jgi:protein-tyrosine phosphatase
MSIGIPPSLLSGALNFRAVKPYKAADGRCLRENTIYRSGELSRLTDADLEIIAGLNIRLVCDLRTDREQADFFSRWPDHSFHRKLEMPGREQSDAGSQKFFDLIAAHPGDTGALQAMDTLYRRKPRTLAKSLHVLLETILAGEGLPVLIHCHAGKDRTGFITAMLLAAVGIGLPDIIDDYIITAHYFRPEHESVSFVNWAKESYNVDLDTVALRPLVDARQDYLETAFAEIRSGWGSVETYLQDEAGLTSEARERLQHLLLV